jgi:hypothetical protein
MAEAPLATVGTGWLLTQAPEGGLDLCDRRRFATQVEARLAVFEYIEGCPPASLRPRLSVPISYEKKSRRAA